MIGLGSFDTTSSGQSNAAAINGGGSVTGWAENDDLYGGASHAFIWKPSAPNAATGTMVDLGTLAINPIPGYSRSEGLAINSSGVVVGDSDPAGSTGQTDAVIWQPGAGATYTLSDLNSLIPSGTGWMLTRALAINDAGLIVAEGTQGGYSHAVLLTPQTTATALTSPAAHSAPGAIHLTTAAPATAVPISSVVPEGPAPERQSGPAPTAERAVAPSANLSIFDFALADLVARPRPKSLLNDGVARPKWSDPGIS
jgi:probable HAF family extracellular repeat protein